MNKDLVTTDIEWLPSLPFNWEIRKVKHCFNISKLKAKINDPVVLKLARDSVQIRNVSNNEGQIAESYFDYNPVKKGDLLINPMDLYSGANCNVSEVEGVISPAYINLRKKVDLDSKYFDYYFKFQYWTFAMFAHGKGVSFDNRWTINAETMMNYEIPFPPYHKQRKIVEALTTKLKKVDRLILNQINQIEKLKEYKQSVISETVTKGLDSSASLKDSGIEWIGKIPQNWDIDRLKYVSSSNDESLSAKTEPDIQIEYVDIGSVSQENGIEKTEFFFFKDAPSRARRITQKNDILISTVRTYLKAIAFVTKDNLIASTGFSVIRPNDKVDSIYLSYFLKSDYFTERVSAYSYGISYPAINNSVLTSFDIVKPPLDIQKKISEYLIRKTKQINRIIEVKTNKIQQLNEYKKSIIYEYVTGKKEVS